MPDLSSLIASGESETTEFKERWSDQSALRELAAFANSRGGTLLVGIADDGTGVGWGGGDLDALASKIADSLRVHPTALRTEEMKGEEVLVARVPEAQAPVAYRGRYYHRVGATTREIPSGELTRFLSRRSGQTWDALPSDRPVSEISDEALRQFIERASGRLPEARPGEKARGLLRKLDLLADEDAPTRAALLLFGERPQALSFSAHVRMGRFKDDTTIVDEAALKGTLFDQLDAAMRLFRQYLEVRYEIPGEEAGKKGLEAAQRREVWTYPLEALREAVVNALVHRDYAALGNVEIRVYDNRVIVGSPGGLPEGITLEELREPRHASIQRNPRWAQTFYYAGLVERWGTGTARIAEACRERGLPEPVFEATGDRFTVTFSQDRYAEERLEEMGLTERQMLVMREVRAEGSISNAEVQELTGVSDRTALRDLNVLEEEGLLRRTDQTGRGTRYELRGADSSATT